MVTKERSIRVGVFAAALVIFLFAGLAMLAGSTSAAHLGAGGATGKTSAPAACGAIGFTPATNYATGTGPSGAAVADFNRDGRPDLAVSNYRGAGGDSISVLLGNGDGTLRPQTAYPTGSLPYTVVAGDFNSDGRPDLAAGNGIDSTVSVLLGNGDGTFRPQATFVVGSNPVGLTAGDFNNDGRLDLATADYNSNTISVLLGNGDGTFRAKAGFPVGGSPYSVVTSDVNNDGRLDLATANSGSANVSVLLGNGDGTFRTQATFAVGSAPRSVTAGDFDGDRRPDLATANYADNNVSVLLGNGDGTFRAQTTFPAGSGPQSLTTADFSGDVRLDLVVANFGGSNVSVLQGNGDGTFQPQILFFTGSGPDRVAAGDFNGDSRPDLATPNYADSNVSVLLNNCTSSGSTPTPTVAASPTATTIPGGFEDVPSGSPFYPYVTTLTSHGAVTGYACGGPGEPCDSNNNPYFRPGANVTRGQLSKIIALAAGLNSTIPPNQQTFHDVVPGSTFHLYIEQLAQTGAIAGYSCGPTAVDPQTGTPLPCDSANRPWFSSGDLATRGQISKIVSIAAGFNEPVPANQQSFTDVPNSSTFWQYIERLAGRGIIGGYNDTGHCAATGVPCFLSNDKTTRGQMAKVGANAFYPNGRTAGGK